LSVIANVESIRLLMPRIMNAQLDWRSIRHRESARTPRGQRLPQLSRHGRKAVQIQRRWQ
jgi:hypothetical protein